MSDLTRREAFRAAALGATALAGGATIDANADDRNGPLAACDDPKAGADDRADRERVIACGFTEAEADCWELVSKAAGKFFELPKLHVMDDHEVAHAIHL